MELQNSGVQLNHRMNMRTLRCLVTMSFIAFLYMLSSYNGSTRNDTHCAGARNCFRLSSMPRFFSFPGWIHNAGIR